MPYTSSDLQVLAQLFAPEAVQLLVFDPQATLLRDSDTVLTIVPNESALQVRSDAFSVVFCLAAISKMPLCAACFYLDKNFKPSAAPVQKYFFVHNPNGTMRWVFPDNLPYPSFLTLYNASGRKAKIIRFAFKLAFAFRQKQRLASGFFWLHAPNNAVQKIVTEQNAAAYSIFTGTVGKNRKAILELNNGKRTTHFAKIPLSATSAELVRAEREQLQYLAGFKFKKSVLPHIKTSENPAIAVLSNVQPTSAFLTSNDLLPVHLNALTEWYAATLQQKKLAQLTEYQRIITDLNFLSDYPTPQNDLSPTLTRQLIDNLKQLAAQFSPTDEYAVAMAHYDFTPWNMYCTAEQLFVYDWELSKTEIPLLYDAFHFIFQAGILVKRSPFETLQTDLENLKKNTAIKDLSRYPNFDVEKNYHFYLLSVVSYYLRLYLQQTPLHAQAHWLIETWLAATNAATRPLRPLHQ